MKGRDWEEKRSRKQMKSVGGVQRIQLREGPMRRMGPRGVRLCSCLGRCLHSFAEIGGDGRRPGG